MTHDTVGVQCSKAQIYRNEKYYKIPFNVNNFTFHELPDLYNKGLYPIKTIIPLEYLTQPSSNLQLLHTSEILLGITSCFLSCNAFELLIILWGLNKAVAYISLTPRNVFLKLNSASSRVSKYAC